jgi:hypothetical protein
MQSVLAVPRMIHGKTFGLKPLDDERRDFLIIFDQQ